MKCVLAAALLMPLSVAANECNITEEQESVLHFAYSYGEPHNLGYSMAAIAMEESDLGQYNLNLQDPSASPWHVTIDKAVNKLEWRHTPFNYNRAAQLLMNDPFLGAEIALETVMWWLSYHDGDWFKTWASYNGGFKGNPRYAHKIANNIKTIKECGWNVNVLGDMK